MIETRIGRTAALTLLFLGQVLAASAQPAADNLERGNELAREAFRLSREGDLEAAVDKYREALEAAPELNGARFTLARLLAGLSRYEEAGAEFEVLVTANPQDVAAHRGKATALLLLDRWQEARQSLEYSLRTVVPRDGQLAHLLARVLSSAPVDTARDGSLALEMAMWVYEVQKKTAVGETIAMAFAEVGEFQRAVDIQSAMIKIVTEAGDDPLLALMRERLAAYESRQPWRAKSPMEIIQSTELPSAGG